jgi:imidazolonepropionase-like amidohydrolase
MMRWRLPRTLVCGLLLVGAGMALAQEAATTPTERDEDRKPSIVTHGNCVIRGGHVWTVSGEIIENGSILVRDGKIAAVGREIQVPAGTTEVDARGKWITPGIIDAHSHIASDATNEGSDSITPEVRIHDVLNSQGLSLYRALAGGLTSALILHGSANTIGGQSVVIKIKWKRPVEELPFPGAPRFVKFALGENVKQSNFRPERGQPMRFPATRMGVEATLRRAFDEARQYQAEWDRWQRERPANTAPPRRDLRLEALSEILRGDIQVQCHAYRTDEMLMLMRLSKEYGFKIAAFQHALEAYKIAPEIRAAGVGMSTFADMWAYKAEAWDAIPYNAALCAQAGIVSSINSDDAERMRRLNLDAAKSIKHGGMSDNSALKLVTLNPAIQLGIAHRAGTLEVGKDADIAIWQGYPLSVYSRCVMTLVDGEVLFQRRDVFKADPTAVTEATPPKPGRPDPASLHPPRTSRSYAIIGATVHPVSGPDISNGTVLITDGRIAAVGERVRLPEGDVTTVNARGLHVYPGLIDGGSQLGLTEVGSVRGTEDTQESGDIEPDMLALTAVNSASEHFAVTRFNGITAALTRASGLIGGRSAVINLAGWTPQEMAVKSPVALHVTFPEGLPAAFRTFLTPEEFAQREAQGSVRATRLREFLDRAKLYAAGRAANADAVTRDTRLEVMMPYVTGKEPVVFHVNSSTGIRNALKLAGEVGLKPILAGARDAWKTAPQLAEKKIPVIYGPVYSLPGSEYDPYDAPYAAPGVLHRAGVKLCFQSADASSARDLPHMAGIACAYGLPRDAALRALTLGAAEILGVADRMGSLEHGKLANVVVADGDLLEPTTSVRYLFIAGKPVPLESKHTRLYLQYRQRLAAGSDAGDR